MTQHWSTRLWKALNWKGWSQRELARRSGIDVQKIYKYLQGKVDQPRGDTLLHLADVLGVSEIWLRSDVGLAVDKIPLVGQIVSGESFTTNDNALPENLSEEISFSLDDADPIALVVTAESMLPVYRPGDILICARRRGGEMSEGLNRDCAVMTAAGVGYVTRLIQGATPQTFNLITFNSQPVMEVNLLWVAPVLWVKRG